MPNYTDSFLNNLVINKMTKEQYTNPSFTPKSDELYFIINDVGITPSDLLGTAAVGSDSSPIYWTGNNFAPISDCFLRLSGGTMTGGITLTTGNDQTSAFNSKGIIFTRGGHIGESIENTLGIYSAGKLCLRPSTNGTSYTNGIEISTSSLIPTTSKSLDLGDSTHIWKSIYSNLYNDHIRIETIKVWAKTGTYEAGWKRVCTLQGLNGYGVGRIYINGTWSSEQPTLAAFDISFSHTDYIHIKQVLGSYVSTPDAIRIVRHSTNGKWYFDVHIPARNATGATGDRYVTFVGKFTISEINNEMTYLAEEPANGTTMVTRNIITTVDQPSITVDLASTTAGLFTGKDMTTGITGTLPVSHGGTGATTEAQARINLGLKALAIKDSLAWDEISNKPSSFTPSSHTHGNITNDGKLETASLAVVTDVNKLITTIDLTTNEPTSSGSGIDYIATISQSATGKITATKSTVRNASTSQTGVLQFTDTNTNAQLNTLSTGSSVPKDADYYISQYVGGGTTTTSYHRRPMSALWSYVKGKITSDIPTLYWANQTLSNAASYNTTPEVASVKIGNGTTATSTKNVILQYDSTNEVLNFVFT